MLSFENLNVPEDIKSVLMKFKIDFVFQPIFNRGKEIIAHEALMRPEGKNVLDFIAECQEKGELHELELVSFFGATMAYRQRNYDTKLGINSFPSEVFTVTEAEAYSKCFRPIKDKLVIEILEYTEDQLWKWNTKQAHTRVYDGIEISLDDFGSGHNDREAVYFYNPDVVKLDRSLISDIDKHPDKLQLVLDHIKEFHDRGIKVLAEGVETEEEYNLLMDHGVDYFQGYYLARPA